MSGKKPGPSIKDDELYESLRNDGASQEKAARIANAAANDGRSTISRRGGEADEYKDWKVGELRNRARELGIKGRSSMRKNELIEALRSR